MVTFWISVILAEVVLIPILGGIWLGMCREKEDMKQLLLLAIESKRRGLR